MCSYNTLHLNDDGCVVMCNGCTGLQVAFGTIAMALSRNEFMDLCEIVNAEKNEWKDNGFPASKSIYIPTKCRSLSLVFSYREIVKLHALLANASLILKAQELLEENEIHPFS